MVGNNATNVSTGKPQIAGAVFVGAIDKVTVPTDAKSELTGFDCLGYVTDSGLENGNEMDVSETKAWGGAVVYRSLTKLNDIFTLALLEQGSVVVLKNVYGDKHVTEGEDGEVHVEVVAEDPQEKVWVFDLALRGNKKKRIVIPDGAVTKRETIKYNDEDAIAYGITISAYPDAVGCSHHEYFA